MRKTSLGARVPRRLQDWLPVSETSLHPRRSTGAGLKFWISTYSADLLTAIISTERTLVAVAVGGGFVAVGSGEAVPLGIDVNVAVGTRRVGVCVPVGEAVRVGNAEGTKLVRVGKGVNVGKSKLNKEVGVACGPAVPSVGKTLGLGRVLEGLRDNKGIRTEQRQQNTSTNRAGIRTLTTCPCRR